MAVYTNTTLGSGLTIDRKWDTRLLKARYAKSVVMPIVLNKSDMVSKSGDTISIDIEPKYTTGTVTAATGAFTPLNTAPTQINITVDTWKYVAIEETDQAKIQSFWDPEKSTFPDGAADALSVDYDTDLLGLHGSVAAGNIVGAADDPQPFDDVYATEALLKLADLNVPSENLTFILPPVGIYKGWYKKEILTAAHSTGDGKNYLLTGKIPSILNTPVRISTCVASATGGQAGNITIRKAMLLHKEALGIGMQLNHKYKRFDRVHNLFLSEGAVMHSLYGVAVVRSDHFVVMNVRS